MPNDERQLEAVQAFAFDRMSGQGAGHDWDHVQRVLSTSEKIGLEVGANLFVVRLAAILHDIGDAKFHEGQDKSGEFSREILARVEVDAAVCDEVVHIVDNLSFRKRAHSEPLSLEGQVVQDADRLDALGAIGIIRTIEFGAWRKQPFHRKRNGETTPESTQQKTGIDHFSEKLLHLRSTLNTQPARDIALSRELFMKTFLRQFFSEIGEAPPSELAALL